jgi:hypothetical protein
MQMKDLDLGLSQENYFLNIILALAVNILRFEERTQENPSVEKQRP